MAEPEPAEPGPRFPAGRRRLVAIAAVVVAVVLGVTLAVVVRSGDEPPGIADGPLLKARAGADEIPAGRIVEKIPDDCGVSEATAARLAPGADPDPEKGGVFRQGGPGKCKWYSLDDGKAECDWCQGDFENERVLDVDISLAEGDRQTPISEAMERLRIGGPGTAPEPGPPQIVEGLGEEAVAHYSTATDMQGASVAFRVGNAVVTVRYRGWDRVRGEEKTISEKVALEGAFAAAAETAKSMGTSARPVVSEVRHPVTPPLPTVPRPCDTVPGKTVDKVARGAERKKGTPYVLAAVHDADLPVEGCVWEAGTPRSPEKGRSRTLTVSIGTARERVPGAGAYTATRHFQGVYRNQRAGEFPTLDTYTGFRPLAGPGDRAFAVIMRARNFAEGDVGLVVFRKRNVLVEVAYQGRDGETELRDRELIDAAYTVAVEIERTLES
ncbi:hypothetical protein [Actinomadura algeriensis]|uniref:DUF3558 domain-containing protein n=1 Tax=Actinomadura algeriensis TaxID=1679523 RepID=A0ABR9JN28_9ACTN|nr:hypothetical protein [Actinomadura algeriensis]MBE1531898.1 hypothetical protein [Actinomadura algeriensis]